MRELVNKVNLSSFQLKNFFKFMLARLACKKLNILTSQPCLHAVVPLVSLVPLGQSECTYYLSYFINRYVPPQRVRFLHRFGLKMGIDFAHFGLESGMVFEETIQESHIYCFNSN